MATTITQEIAAQESEILAVSTPKKKKALVAADAPKSNWQKAIDYFGIAAEVSNVGIAIEVVGKLIPRIAAAGGPALTFIAFLTDPLIYFFRSLILSTKIIGKERFGVVFEEDKHGGHKYQTAVNFLRLALFSVAIPLFFGLITASPIGLTIAWALAITSLCLGAHFDYAHQAKMAQAHFKKISTDPSISQPEKDKAEQEAQAKTKSYHLFVAMLVGVSFLFLCGTAAVFAPPALVPILLILTKVASAYLAAINLGRLFNWRKLTSSSAATTEKANSVGVKADNTLTIEEVKGNDPVKALQSTAQVIEAADKSEANNLASLTVDTSEANETASLASVTTPSSYSPGQYASSSPALFSYTDADMYAAVSPTAQNVNQNQDIPIPAYG